LANGEERISWLRSGRNGASYVKHLTAAGGNDGAVTPTEYAVRRASFSQDGWKSILV